MSKRILMRIALIMTLLFVIGSTIFYQLLEDYYEGEALKKIDQLLIYNLAVQHYVSQYQRPALEDLLHEHNLSEEYFNPFLLSSTFIAQQINKAHEYISHAYHFPEHRHDISKNPWDLPKKFIHHKNLSPELIEAQGNQQHVFREHAAKYPAHQHMFFQQISDNPTNPNNRADAYERGVLKRFRDENLTRFTERIEKDGVPYTFYALAPERNKAACLRCHSDPAYAPADMLSIYGESNGFGEQEGDLHSITAVYAPVHSDYRESLVFYFLIEGLMLIVFLIIFYIIYHYTRQIHQKDQLIAKQSQFAAMGEMVGMIAHQWRQPLTGIGMTVENMKLDIDLQTVDEIQWGANLESISRQIHYLSHTIDDFRNFFRPGQKAIATDVNQVLDDSLQVIASTLENNRIRIEKRYAELPTTMTYRNELLQVFLNLLKNSKDAYIDNRIDDRIIELESAESNGKIIVTFHDRAGGISPEIIERIFDPYFSTKDEKIGTGIGLYMSKIIVEDHLGGSIDVVSEGTATSFTVTLPVIVPGGNDGD